MRLFGVIRTDRFSGVFAATCIDCSLSAVSTMKQRLLQLSLRRTRSSQIGNGYVTKPSYTWTVALWILRRDFLLSAFTCAYCSRVNRFIQRSPPILLLSCSSSGTILPLSIAYSSACCLIIGGWAPSPFSQESVNVSNKIQASSNDELSSGHPFTGIASST